MASAFQLIVDAIKVQLDTDWKNNGVTFKTDRVERDTNTAPDTVYWVNTGGEFEPADAAGPAQYDLPTNVTVASNAFGTDALVTEVDVWGTDKEQADLIRHRLYRAMHRVLTQRSMAGISWDDLTQKAENAGRTVKGVKQRMNLQLMVPILDVEEQETALVLTTPLADEYVDVLP